MPPLDELPLSRFGSFIFWYLTKDAQEADIEKFKQKLWRPPPGEVIKDENHPWSARSEMKALGGLKQALGK